MVAKSRIASLIVLLWSPLPLTGMPPSPSNHFVAVGTSHASPHDERLCMVCMVWNSRHVAYKLLAEQWFTWLRACGDLPVPWRVKEEGERAFCAALFLDATSFPATSAFCRSRMLHASSRPGNRPVVRSTTGLARKRMIVVDICNRLCTDESFLQYP